MNQTEHGVKQLGAIESWLCSADLTGKENRLVTHNGATGVALTDAIGDSIAGLIVNAAGNAERADIRPWVTGGVYKVRVSAAVADAAFLQLDTTNTGELVTLTTGFPVAQALEASSGAGNIRVRALSRDGTALGQPAPVTLNATATMALGDILAGIITSSTAAAVTGTTRTGTQLKSELPWVQVGGFHDFTIINTGGTNAFTLAGGTDVTVVGSAVVALSSSGRFRAKNTTGVTWVIYRIS